MHGGRLVGYCIRRRDDPPPTQHLAGVDGHPVHALVAGRLAIWLSNEALGPATVERARAHDRVIREAMATSTPLPLRYGAHFADEAAAAILLHSRADGLLASLQRVESRVEMGLRVLWKAPPPARTLDPGPAGTPAAEPPAAPRTGREYLERRREEIRAAEATAACVGALLDRVESHFPGIPVVRSTGKEQGVAGSLAHLVQEASLAPYRTLVESARDDLVEARLVVTGPWAPYSFV